MKITLKGQFMKQEFLQAVSDQLNEYMDEDMTINATLYLRFKDAEGKKIDWVDKNENSLEVTINKSTYQKTNTLEQVKQVYIAYREERKSTTIATELEMPLANVEQLYQEFKELQINPSIMFISREELTPYMILGSELNIENAANMEKVEWVGVTLVGGLRLEKVYSIQFYCQDQGLGFQKQIDKQYTLYLTKKEVEERGLSHLSKVTRPHGLTIKNGDILFFYDIEKLLNENGLKLFEGSNAPEGHVKLHVNGLTAEQIERHEVGYIIERSLLKRKFIPVYHPATLYNFYNVRILSKEEIEERKGITLFTNHRLTPYFPKSYDIKGEMKVCGYDEEGKEYVEPIRPLYEKFGLIESSELKPDDLALNTRYTKKLQGLLKKEGIDINNVYPDGMTEEHKLVYRASRIPKQVIAEYKKYEREKEADRVL
ncbi:hypothetical protein CN918_30880 [Priestia megaterium]|nr:hypothetical protein CN918_30880 [Priestia megaterium]